MSEGPPNVETSTMSTSWESWIAGMRVWSRGGARAVHKPLLVLMILARAQRGGPANVFRFRDLDGPLREGLASFAQGTKARRSELPFWRLREDGFWRVHDEARLAKGARGAPSRRALLDADAAAEVPIDAWEELRRDPARVARLIQAVVTAHWPLERRGEVLSRVVFDLEIEEEI